MRIMHAISTGLVLAVALGCSSDSRKGTTVAPPLLSLAPAAPMFDSDTQALKASMINGRGMHLAWSADQGTVSASGVYQSPAAAGVYTVTVKVLEVPSVSATIQVPVRRIDVAVKPKDTTLQPQQSVRILADVTGGLSTEQGVKWTPTGGAVDAFGIWTAPAKDGVYVVRAQSLADQRKYDDSTITVGNPQALLVTPRDARLMFGDTLQFAVAAYGLPDPSVIWSTTGGGIDQTGLFSGTEVGTWRITATSKYNPNVIFTATATVITIPNGLTVFVFPNPAAVQVGGKLQFTSRVDGSTNGDVLWSCSGGSITKDGLFTAPMVLGNVTVTATSVVDPAASSTASVAIVQ